MILRMYALRDDVSRSYLAPSLNSNDEAAKRDLAIAVAGSASAPLGFQPRDFRLFCISTYDTDTGVIVPVYPQEFVCCAADLVGDSNG